MSKRLRLDRLILALQVPPPRPGEGERAGQQPLGQQRVDELAQPSFAAEALAQSGLALLAILPQGGVEGRSPGATGWIGSSTGGSCSANGGRSDCLLMSSLRRRMRTSARFALSWASISDSHLEPDRVEQFQQAGEADGLAVVRRGRGEDAMLEEEADFPQHPRPLAGPAAALRGEVVALVHDQQVPRGVGGRAARRSASASGPAPDAWRNCSSTSGIRR